jgi:UDP-sugar transporter A1/2/3
LNPSQICQSFQGGLEQSRGLGFACALFACVLSGLAGIYFEKILKGSADVSVWMRNVQLSLLSLPLGFALAFIKDGSAIEEKGFFFG